MPHDLRPVPVPGLRQIQRAERLQGPRTTGKALVVPTSRPSALSVTDPLDRITRWLPHLADECSTYLPDDLIRAAKGREADIEAALNWFLYDYPRVGEGEARRFLVKYCGRAGLDVPEPEDLDDDVADLADWPVEVFKEACQHIRRFYRYRRCPMLADFEAAATDARERRSKLIDGLRKLLHQATYRRVL